MAESIFAKMLIRFMEAVFLSAAARKIHSVLNEGALYANNGCINHEIAKSYRDPAATIEVKAVDRRGQSSKRFAIPPTLGIRGGCGVGSNKYCLHCVRNIFCKSKYCFEFRSQHFLQIEMLFCL